MVNEDLKQGIISDTFYLVPAMQGFIQQTSALVLSKATTGKMITLHFNLVSSFFNDDVEDDHDTANLLYVWWTLFSRLFFQAYPKWNAANANDIEKEKLLLDLFAGSLLLAAKYSLDSTIYTSDFSSLMIESMPQEYKNFQTTTEQLKTLERKCLDALAFRLTPNTNFDTEEKAYEAIQQIQTYAKAYVKLKKYPHDLKSKQLFSFLHQTIEKNIIEANTPLAENALGSAQKEEGLQNKKSILKRQRPILERAAKKPRP